MLSDFSKEFLANLGKRIDGFSFQEGTKHVKLYALFGKSRVNFANLRGPRIRKADVWLKCYLPDDTTLIKKQRGCVYGDGRKGSEIFFKSDDEELSLDAVVRHYNDVKRRIESYEKRELQFAGSNVTQRKRGIGIPIDYFR